MSAARRSCTAVRASCSPAAARVLRSRARGHCSSRAAPRPGPLHWPSSRHWDGTSSCLGSRSPSTSRGSPRRRSAIRTTREPPSGSPRRRLRGSFTCCQGSSGCESSGRSGGDHRGRGVRGPPSVAHAEALLRRSTPRDRARCAARRDLPRHPAHDALPAARAAQPAAGRVPRARPRAPSLAGGAACRRGRHGDPPPPVPPALLASHAAAVPRVLPSDAWRARSRARRGGRANGRGRSARARPVPRRPACHPLLPFADWAVVREQTERLGTVIVGGCRDAAGARQSGFVPARSAPPRCRSRSVTPHGPHASASCSPRPTPRSASAPL